MKKRILVVAKAEPLESKKYGASVCTAGITDNGEFIRIYPVPYKLFCDKKTSIKKYDWIEVDCDKAKDDNRKESYRLNSETIDVIGHIGTKNNWEERNKIILPKCSKNLKELTESGASLGIIKPAEVLNFTYKRNDDKVGISYNKIFQMIFEGENLKKIPAVGKNLTTHYSYVFKCAGEDNAHDIICEDWEVYQSSRSWSQRYGTDDKLWEELYKTYYKKFTTKKDLHFIMGTHFVYKTWIIIGLYYPPKNTWHQTKLFERLMSQR